MQEMKQPIVQANNGRLAARQTWTLSNPVPTGTGVQRGRKEPPNSAPWAFKARPGAFSKAEFLIGYRARNLKSLKQIKSNWKI